MFLHAKTCCRNKNRNRGRVGLSKLQAIVLPRFPTKTSSISREPREGDVERGGVATILVYSKFSYKYSSMFYVHSY